MKLLGKVSVLKAMCITIIIFSIGSVLVQRANNWLEEHDGLQLVSCETITWTSVAKKEIFSDSTHFKKTNRSYDSTYIFRGLR
jgi:hypothetical protein